jgi:hypothetical protein
MTLSTRSRIFWGHLGLKTAPRFSGCDPLASAAEAAFFRLLLGGEAFSEGVVWLGPASGFTGTAEDVGWQGAGTCLARDARAFLTTGGLDVLAGTSKVAALEGGGLVRILFAGGMISGSIIDGSACWLMDIWI